MDSIIGVLNTCFMVCLAFTILFFVISVVLFFLFDIRTIFNIKTGRAQAKTVKEMQTANASTGRLRVGGKTQTTKLSKEEKYKKKAPAVAPPPQPAQQDNNYNSNESSYDSAATAVLSQNAAATEILAQNDETQLLQNNSNLEASETSVLSTNQINPTDAAKQINFVITKKILCIHTDEVID
jgi:hypothetical protein